MRILHTSDWHIGKRLIERDRLPEQIAALRSLVKIAEENDVDVVLVAGDVFDTFTPSAEAEEVFFRAVKELAGSSRAVVAVSGNHDDGVRLCASSALAGEYGVYLFGGEPHSFPLGGNRPVHAVRADEHSIVLENGKSEQVYINALPYPNEARLREKKSDESYFEKVAQWIEEGDTTEPLPKILLTHLFVAGAKAASSERDISLGGARVVPVSVFPNDYYVALGHLHKKQSFGENIRYSGSLLQYSFDETPEKSAILLETEGTAVRVIKEIPISGGRRLVRLECNSLSEGLELLPRYMGCWIELTLHLDEPLTQAGTAALGEANGGLVSLNVLVKSESVVPVESRAAMDDTELFEAYYRSQWGEAPSEELKTVFLRLLSEEV